MLKIIFSALLLFFCLATQAQQTTQRELTAVDYLNYFETTRNKISAKLTHEIAQGRFTAHKDKYLRIPITQKEFEQYYREAGTYIDSALYDEYTEVTIISIIEPDQTKGFAFYDERTLIFNITDKDSVFVDYNALKKLLTAEQVNLFDFFRYRKRFSLNYDVAYRQAKKEFTHLALLVYNLGNNGTLKAYKNDSLTSVYTIAEIKERVTGIEYKTAFHNPASSDSIPCCEYAYDSIIYHPYYPDSIQKIRLLDGWEHTGDFTAQTKLLAIAPTYSPVVAGLHLPAQPAFWLKTGDILSHLTAEEKIFYNYFFYYHLKNPSIKIEEGDFIYDGH